MSGVIQSVYLSVFNGLKGPGVCLVGVRVTGLMETPPPWHTTIYIFNNNTAIAFELTMNFVHEFAFPASGKIRNFFSRKSGNFVEGQGKSGILL